MPFRDLFHGAEADKLLFNIRNGSLTANSQGQLFFAEREWQNCLIHGADRQMGESYAAKFRVDIPEGAQLARASTSGNPDTRILKIEPGAQVRAQVLELHVRRGRVGSFETETIPQGGVQAYLENKIASVRGAGNTAPPVTEIQDDTPSVKTQIPDESPPPAPEVDVPSLTPEVVVPKPGVGSARIYLDAAKAGIKAGLKSLLTAETLVGVAATLGLAYADKVAAEDAIRRIKVKFIKEGFAKGVAAGVMRWTEDDVALNAMNRVTTFRVQGLGDPAGYLNLAYILKVAEVYENYAVGVGYYFSYSQSLQWQQKMRAEGFARLKQFGYYNYGLNEGDLFEYDFIANLAWALHWHTNKIVEPAIRFGK
jgi:hypothetical protein